MGKMLPGFLVFFLTHHKNLKTSQEAWGGVWVRWRQRAEFMWGFWRVTGFLLRPGPVWHSMGTTQHDSIERGPYLALEATDFL